MKSQLQDRPILLKTPARFDLAVAADGVLVLSDYPSEGKLSRVALSPQEAIQLGISLIQVAGALEAQAQAADEQARRSIAIKS